MWRHGTWSKGMWGDKSCTSWTVLRALTGSALLVWLMPDGLRSRTVRNRWSGSRLRAWALPSALDFVQRDSDTRARMTHAGWAVLRGASRSLETLGMYILKIEI